jgi:cytidylate kinase
VHRQRPIVAIDGPAGAGKSTIARLVATRLEYTHIDTGAMYRAVAFAARVHDLALEDGESIARVAENLTLEFKNDGPFRPDKLLINGTDHSKEIRTPEVSRTVPIIAQLPAVRRVLLVQQRRLGMQGGVVMEGRDIGTSVFPDAEVKIFLDADPGIRAVRHHADLVARGQHSDLATVERDLRERDKADREREHEPLRQAPDALLIDSTSLSIEQVVQQICERTRMTRPLSTR